MEYAKWDGRRHWHFEVEELSEDDHGHWFHGRPGVLLQRADEPAQEEIDGFVMLVPHSGDWIAFWNREDNPAVYVDVTTAPRLEGGTIGAIDLDLDVIAWRDGRVEVVDRDEFEAHRVSLGYPLEVVTAAKATAAWLEAEMTAARAPFDDTGSAWLEEAARRWQATSGRRVRLAAFALPVREGRVLLARHTYGPPLWALVGGVVEHGESLVDAAGREVLEETGLSVEVGNLLGIADRSDLSLYVFEARVLGARDCTPQVEEIQELAWFTASELAGHDDVFEFARTLALRALDGGSASSWSAVEMVWPEGEHVPVYFGRHG